MRASRAALAGDAVLLLGFALVLGGLYLLGGLVPVLLAGGLFLMAFGWAFSARQGGES